ncbi:MAG: zf-HC2 domain-containing protein [Planctomycetota bacterium]
MAGRLEQYEQLTAYLDGELSEAERAEVERLLESDAEARALLEELRETARLIGTVPREFAGKGFNEAVRARLERESLLSEESARPMRWWKPMALAASLMVVSTVVYFGMARLQQERERRVFALVDAESARPMSASKSPAVAQQEMVGARGQAVMKDAVATAGRSEAAGQSEGRMKRSAGEAAIAANAAPGKADAPAAAPVFGVAESDGISAAHHAVDTANVPVERSLDTRLLMKAARPMASRSATSQPTTQPATSQPASQPTTSQATGEKPRG